VDVRAHNKHAWNQLAAAGDRWTLAVSHEEVEAARRGEWHILLTETRPVPRDWFPPLSGAKVLCLGGGGGQQGPILAAAGAHVLVVDNSPRQLQQDERVARDESLPLSTLEADMADLHELHDASFDLVVHPCSNCFVPDVRPVWREAARVLRRGGLLLAGFINPAVFLFDDATADGGELQVRHKLPYSDVSSLGDEARNHLVEHAEAFLFSHTLETLIGDQMAAGFVLTAMYEDVWPGRPLSEYMPCYIATRAVRV
jgi:SAM-dependent methyltransferase